MDPVTIGAVLLAIVSGAGSQLGVQLWESVVSLVRRPFHRKAAAVLQVSSGEAEVAALQQAPSDQSKALRSVRDFARKEWPLRGSSPDGKR